MREPEDVVGKRFGRLVVLREVARRNRTRRVRCRCDCGTEKVVQLGHLRSGATLSCGCYAREVSRRDRRKHGLFVGHAYDVNTVRTRLYRTWVNMIQRCENPKNPSYPRYGGRGIRVCDAWHDFGTFRAWARAHGQRDDLTIDRVDNDGPYAPENCRWATYTAQRRNRPDVHRVPVNGMVLTLTEASAALGVSRKRLRAAIKELGAVSAVRHITQEASR